MIEQLYMNPATFTIQQTNFSSSYKNLLEYKKIY